MISLRFLLLSSIFYLVLSLSAGRWDVWSFVAWPGVVWLAGTLTYGWLERVNPALVQERMHPPNDRDRATRRLTLLPLLGVLVTAGLDVRFGWSQLPLGLVVASLVLFALSFALVAWVLAVNSFASSAVRVQTERGHAVISHGPYAWVRHPMYLATLLACISSGPALGSWFAGLLTLPIVALFIRRTRVEDRMLFAELSGYAEYAARVRWRVVPYVF
ncbi:MAG TPA: isoprenylcysteine carboxylmethyltransferase family protein [Polyangiales bacterium]|nr:isoprenylcysteine carboxylmethyltransferase family protein [Polyangiales bacterium]